ncbi:MAG: hypothetical protein Q9219_005717 [cf. Caloplaca sp. 3 TL-2023]
MQNNSDDYNVQLQGLGHRWISHDGRRFDLVIFILAAVNVAAACLMIVNIIYDARSLAQSRMYSQSSIHPAEILPLIISFAIIAQGVIFVIIQPTSGEVLMQKCRTVAQIIWPILWLVPYTMLVFGLETTFRALHKKRFQVQKIRDIWLCVVAILILTLVTWLPTRLFPARRTCLASLVWWTTNFAKIGLVLASGLFFTFLVCAMVITVQLIRTIKMSRDQRIAATRIVYYLIVSALIMALVVPFFAQKTMHVDAVVTSKVAEVALNILGILHLWLHVFLRANADETALRPIESTWITKQRLRLFGPSDLEMTAHVTSPVLLDKEGESGLDNDNRKLVNDLHRFSRAAKYVSSPTVEADNEFARLMSEKRAEKVEGQEPLRSPSQAVLSPRSPRKPSNYSIFPTFRSAMLRNSMSTTFSQDSEDAMLPPQPLLPWNHRRELSEQSSATVQIGCRLSNLNDTSNHPSSSSRGTSFRLPIYGTNLTIAESPPISPLSTRLQGASRSSPDLMALPIQSNQNQRGGNWRNSRLGTLSPNKAGRQQSQVKSPRELSPQMTMKALPPDPPAYSF